MKRPVQWSRHAVDDLKTQVDHVAADNPAAARRMSARILSTAGNLGKAAIGRQGRVAGTYEKSVPRLPHIIAYAITARPDGGEVVTILRVIHGARNWPAGTWPK